MTFGWGADRDQAKAIFDGYVGRAGNFVDTANGYADGTAEQIVGEFARSRREELVIATKYSMPMRPGDPNSGGNSRKSMVRSVEDSLARLATDYVDLLYLHMWDGGTPVEEVLRAMDDLVRAGKVLYVAISDIPSWQVSRMQAITELRGWAPLVALQIPYNLVEQTVERDLIPMAETMGLGVVGWSPLAGGVLTGKYGASDLEPGTGSGGGSPEFTRRDQAVGNGFLTERGLDIADVVKDVAGELDTRVWCTSGYMWRIINQRASGDAARTGRGGSMTIRRAVPDIRCDDFDASRDFYVGVLGFEIGMDMDWVLTFVSPSNPTAQVILIRNDASAPVDPQISVEVDDVDAVHAEALRQGVEIVHPLTDEPWGVRRFFARDPNGIVVNVLSHRA